MPSAVRPGADEGRVLSVLPLSTACDDEIVGVGADRPGQSAVVRRIAVVARRLAPHVLPPDADLRLRIPIDLRHRGLGIPRGAVGNHWHDALAVIDGPVAALPPVAGVADAVDAALSDRLAPLRPEHVEHREDESLRLLVDHGGEPIRRGVDLVFSCLPAPVWPGVRAVHVLGSASLGVVHVRGARSVDVVTEGPLPSHVTAV